MRRFWNIVRLSVAIAAVVAMFFVMTEYSEFIYWISANTSRAFFLGFVAVSFCVAMAWGIWMEKRAQKRLGVKRPLFRSDNDTFNA